MTTHAFSLFVCLLLLLSMFLLLLLALLLAFLPIQSVA